MIFHWDMAIYRCSKWWLYAILELFYHHTRPHTKSVAGTCWPQLPVKFHVNVIHRSIWIFLHIWLEMPIQAPKMGVLGDFRHLNVIIYHQDSQKGHPCINPHLSSYQLWKSVRGVWPVGELAESVTDTHCTHMKIYILSMHSIGQTINILKY